MFEEYRKGEREYRLKHPVEMCQMKTQTPMLNRSIFLQTIDNVDNMSDSDLRSFIENNFRTILNNIFSGGNSYNYLNCFKNVRFMKAFIDVLSLMKYFDRGDAIKLNTIAYHYLTVPNKDEAVAAEMINMCRIVNRPQIPRLLGLGLTDNLTNMILIARNSDMDLSICVKRVDFIIITQPKELMTENMIVEIFKVIYDVFTQYTYVFEAIMYDVLPDYDENNPNALWVTEEIQEVDSILSLAALDVLDNLPTKTIMDTIYNYSINKGSVYPKSRIRFSLRRLSEDYYRINDCVTKLLYDGIAIP